mmetsp:Transcript_20559/g.34059  ORF Transcript_20559/g.34059 Transcript_20559/m.34059 type:complete len:101 (-) Transcript_20559:109-411(-)
MLVSNRVSAGIWCVFLFSCRTSADPVWPTYEVDLKTGNAAQVSVLEKYIEEHGVSAFEEQFFDRPQLQVSCCRLALDRLIHAFGLRALICCLRPGPVSSQ